MTNKKLEPIKMGVNPSDPTAHMAIKSITIEISINTMPIVFPCPEKVLLLSAVSFAGTTSDGSRTTLTSFSVTGVAASPILLPQEGQNCVPS